MSIILDGTTGVAAPGSSVSGNLNFTGTGNRITGDFSNATAANRVSFQSSTVNGNTILQAIPNGSATTTSILCETDSAVTNSSFAQLLATTTEVSFRSGIRGSGAYQPITFYTGGSERVRIDTSGNVGIGTTSPAQRLGISGNVAVSGQIIAGDTAVYGDGTIGTPRLQWNARTGTYVGAISISDTTNTLDHWVLRNPNGLIGSVGTSGTSLYFATGSAERARIDSSGRVGIGLSSPSYQLHVASASEWPIAIRYASDTQGNRSGMLVQRARGSLASPTTVNANTNLGGIEVGGYNGTSYTSGWNGGGALFFYAEDTWTASSNPTFIGFNTTASGVTTPTERMRITSDGSIRQSGDNARTVQLVKGIATTVSSITVDVTGGDDNTNYLVEIEMAGYLGIFLKYIHTVYKTNSWTNYGSTVIQSIAPAGVSVTFSSPSFGVLRYVITASTTYPLVKAKVTSGGSSINPTVSLSIY